MSIDEQIDFIMWTSKWHSRKRLAQSHGNFNDNINKLYKRRLRTWSVLLGAGYTHHYLRTLKARSLKALIVALADVSPYTGTIHKAAAILWDFLLQQGYRPPDNKKFTLLELNDLIRNYET
jgi:hypothetical protein